MSGNATAFVRWRYNPGNVQTKIEFLTNVKLADSPEKIMERDRSFMFGPDSAKGLWAKLMMIYNMRLSNAAVRIALIGFSRVFARLHC